jgi:hypothetical protein
MDTQRMYFCELNRICATIPMSYFLSVGARGPIGLTALFDGIPTKKGCRSITGTSDCGFWQNEPK